jgi:hypothetical protein
MLPSSHGRPLNRSRILLTPLVLAWCGFNLQCSAPSPSAASLDIGPRDVVTQTVYQRETRTIAASNGSLSFQLGDITGRCVLVSVVDRSGKSLIDRKEMSEGEFTRAKVGQDDFVVSLDRMVNLLMGEDYATLSIMRMEHFDRVAIERLLLRLESSELTFIRNDQEHSGRDIAALLRQKLEFLEEANPTVDEFIDNIASKSIATGEDYAVRRADGKSMPLGDWLHGKAHRKSKGRALKTADTATGPVTSVKTSSTQPQ